MNKYMSKLLESGLVAAIVMCVAYLLTYFNLAGMVSAFNLPIELVEIDIPSIIRTLYKVVMNAWLLLPIIALLAIAESKLNNRELIGTIKFSAALLCIVLFTVFVIQRLLLWDWLLIGLIAYIWAKRLLIALITQRDKKGLRAKWLAAFDDSEDKSDAHAKVDSIYAVCILICALYFCSQTMYYYGVDEVRDDTWHFIARDYDDSVVVFQSEWRYVVMERDGDTLKPSYQVVRFDELGTLDYVETGKLLPEGGDGIREM